jgi:hypothetical protein
VATECAVYRIWYIYFKGIWFCHQQVWRKKKNSKNYIILPKKNWTALSIKENNLMLILTCDNSCNIPMGLWVLVHFWLVLGHFMRVLWKVMCNVTISQHVLYLYLQILLRKSVINWSKICVIGVLITGKLFILSIMSIFSFVCLYLEVVYFVMLQSTNFSE